MKRKESRTAVLYVRLSPSNRTWVKTQAKKFGYKSESEFVDTLVSDLRQVRESLNDRRKKQL